jgi:chromosome segregation ATPase
MLTRLPIHHTAHRESDLLDLREQSRKDSAELALLRQEVRDQAAARKEAEDTLKREVKELRTALNVARWDNDRQVERLTALTEEKQDVDELLRQCEAEKEEVSRTSNAGINRLGTDEVSTQQLEDVLRISEEAHEMKLQAEVANLKNQIAVLVAADGTSTETIHGLEANLRQRDDDLELVTHKLGLVRQDMDAKAKQLADMEDSHRREMENGERSNRDLEDRLRTAAQTLQAREEELELTRNDLHTSVRASASAVAEAAGSKARLDLMSAEIDRLQHEVAQLRSKSANKDLQIAQLQKSRDQLKEDKEMLNIALDSKQQELEIVSDVGMPSRCRNKWLMLVLLPDEAQVLC